MKPCRIASLLLAAVLACVASARAAEVTAAQIAEMATPSVVLIKLPDGLGTGFVVSRDGRIVTNVHVIRGAKQAVVVTADGREFTDIEVMAADEAHDLAVLRIGTHGLQPLALGDSSSDKPGEHVVAIGHPLGLGNTVSDGLVSAVREISAGRSMLQISAPISPGSSGGPVFNDRGEVIGVSTLVVTGGQNLNFAVPINAVQPLLTIDKGVALARYAWPEHPRRHVPTHPLTLLKDCPSAQLRTVVSTIQQAISIGAPLYNKGNIEACYRIYAAAALDMDKKVESCPGPKRALLDGVGTADKLSGWDDKAWAMRDAFDGVLAVAAKGLGEPDPATAAPPQRQIPHHSMAVFAGCSRENMTSIGSGIAAAIHSGAPLYNSGDVEACYRIYEGAISDIDRRVNGCPVAKQALQDGLRTADQRTGWQDKAWALRDAFDGLIDAIGRHEAGAQ